MRLLTRSFLFAIAALLSLAELRASHISGGDVSVVHVADSTFRVSLQLFRDCINANPNALLPEDLVMYAYVGGTADLYDSGILMPLDSIVFPELGDDCYSPEICIEIGFYSALVTLESNPAGYYFSWERCCRVEQTTNLFLAGDAAMVFTATIPDPALMNSSPVFDPYPNDGYFCVSFENSFAFNATDADGDSLVYSLSTPIAGSFADPFDPAPLGGGPMPFDDLTWEAPYDLDDIVGGAPPMSIDPQTGVITASPTLQGFWAYGVVVKEYRDGVKIGEVRREITMESTICDFDVPPMFLGFEQTDTVYFNIFESNVLNIVVEDNPTDSIELSTIQSDLFDSLQYDVTAVLDTSVLQPGLFSGTLQWDTLDCDYLRDEPYWVYFVTESENLCTGERSYDTLNLAIIVQLIDLPTQFVSPAPSYEIFYGQTETYEFPVTAVDGNPFDTLELTIQSPLDMGFNPMEFLPDSALGLVSSRSIGRWSAKTSHLCRISWSSRH